jgi:RHS repeat-associated protein
LPTSATGYVLNLRYPGQYYDAESKTDYNVFRTYEPATGRYLQSDPIGLEGGISTYAYVNNSPLLYSDSSGLARHDPNSLYCRNLAEKIINVEKQLDQKFKELDENNDTLPEYIGKPGRFFQTRRGHRTVINRMDRNLRIIKDKYDDECGPPPPPTMCPGISNDLKRAAKNTLISIGVGLGAAAAFTENATSEVL